MITSPDAVFAQLDADAVGADYRDASALPYCR
jgi:hypothetical protein